MRTFLIILVMVTLTNMAKADSETLSAIAPNAHGDSYEEVLEDSESLEQCRKMIDVMNFDSSSDEYENAHDLCVNKDF